jgi:hypothetical protein
MRDVEELLRETLSDARRRLDGPADLYETVRHSARLRRQRKLRLTGMAAVVVIVGSVAVIVAQATTPGTAPNQVAVTPSNPAVPPIGQHTRVELGAGATATFAIEPSAVFVAQTQPGALLNLSMADLSIKTSIATADDVGGLAVDPAASRLWAWSSTQGGTADQSASPVDSTTIRVYDTSTLATDGTATVAAYTFSAAALDGELWLATSEGLYVLPAGAHGSAAATKVVDGSVFSVAADAARGRVLFGGLATTPAAGSDSMGSIAVVAIDARTHKLTKTGTPLPVGKESIAIVDGQVWVGGYGSGPTPRLIHLNADSLRPIAADAIAPSSALELGPGAIVWPGASVLWVRDGGDEGLSCIDPHTGDVLERWDTVQGPVASVAGRAYAASDGSLEQLTLAADCAG